MVDRKLAVFTVMGFECAGLITACVLIGRYLDQKYGWNGLGAGFGAIIGVVAWVSHLIVVIRDLAKKTEPSHTDTP